MPKWPPTQKPYSEIMTKDELWTYFEKANMVHLATMDGDQPRVRIMALIKHDNKLYTLTHTQWDKVRQISANNKVEFTVITKIPNFVFGDRPIFYEFELFKSVRPETQTETQIP